MRSSMFDRALAWESEESGTGLMILFVMATGLLGSKVFGLRAALPCDCSEPTRGGAAIWPRTLPANMMIPVRTTSDGIWRNMAGTLHSGHKLKVPLNAQPGG